MISNWNDSGATREEKVPTASNVKEEHPDERQPSEQDRHGLQVCPREFGLRHLLDEGGGQALGERPPEK